TDAGVAGAVSSIEIARLRRKFARNHCVLLRGLFARKLLREIAEPIAQSGFRAKKHDWLGSDLTIADVVVPGALTFLVNDRKLFDLVQAITGCGRIRSFGARIYRIAPRRGQSLTWHNDMLPKRLVAMSINLASPPCVGGLLQIRDSRSHRLLHEVANTGYGDAVVFEIAPHLEHRNTAVVGHYPKTAFAGWFMSAPDYVATLNRLCARDGSRRSLSSDVRHEHSRAGFASSHRAALCEGVVFRRIGSQTVVLDIKRGRYYGLAGVGSRIWDSLVDGKRLGEVAAMLSREFSVSREQASPDVAGYAMQLEAQGLLRINRAALERA
ncbi:MAG: PqqD family peptide modification chaperone, partial [Candidatus Binataceae bacterium]